ncbi:unnamed protein product [Angiostrongylus costaricensis]|uniref:Ion_trans domain-containing protein n=1 Tax=Angiostrongylus costaricensis TaxID=334426 RepID=A0A158PHP6_ANGCS|nr:unnamed protein product [Angiostrongylus costaricensis]
MFQVLEYLSAHPLLGPYIQMAAKMVVSMFYIIVLLLVTLMAFGVSRQAITYPHEKWNWLLVRNIFYKPYFMLYGEVYAGEIDTCGDEGDFICVCDFAPLNQISGTNCVPGGWIPPVLMTIFLLVANILLINMLIAIFNNIFNETNIRSHEVWLFQRYGQVMEYNDTPLLPPPFTILAYIGRLFCFCKKKPLSNGKERDDVVTNCSTKLHLSAEELRELHDFEEDCMDELTRRKLRNDKGNSADVWINSLELIELCSQRVNEVLQENCSLKSRLCDMEGRLDLIIKKQMEFMDILTENRKELEVNASERSTGGRGPNRSVKVTVTAPDLCLFTDQIQPSSLKEKAKTPSPLLSHLRMDHTLRKYDEARYQPASIGRRRRLNSLSLSISQDMKDMERSPNANEIVTSNDDTSTVVVHGREES